MIFIPLAVLVFVASVIFFGLERLFRDGKSLPAKSRIETPAAVSLQFWPGQETKGASMVLQKKLICPQCQATGCVSTKKVKIKVGVHGGKVTAAVLTGGISMLGTGLSLRHEKTEATCSNCESSWVF